MAKATSHRDGAPGADRGAGTANSNYEDHEGLGLLSGGEQHDHDDDDGPEFEDKSSPSHTPASVAPAAADADADAAPLAANRLKSAVRPPTSSSSTTSNKTTSHSATPADRTPRTPQRVRFDPNPTILHGLTPNGTAHSFDSSRRDDDDDDDGSRDDDYDYGRDSLDDLDFQLDENDRNGGRQHRRPLLTGIEAPSVALANSPWSLDEHDDVHSWAESERRRPKSGLRSAFMNMANSIIGAGIIGQPYAFKQAGLLSGVLLLVGLTVVVDWTICLIVVNSKLSGANSFQGTVEKCFGKSGLIAISLAQWLFAFGGMVAFGVIVGDTIPHVLQAVWPGLREMPVLGLLADRRAAIVVFILGVSFPLTLYRDIAKVRLLAPTCFRPTNSLLTGM